MSQIFSEKVKDKINEDLSPTKNLTGSTFKGCCINCNSFGLCFSYGMHLHFLLFLILECLKDCQQEQFTLGFALTLAFLIYPTSKGKKITAFDILISFVGAFSCFYIYFFYDQLVDRGGVLLSILIEDSFKLPVELIIGSLGILILLEATRRAIGLPLVIIAICF